MAEPRFVYLVSVSMPFHPARWAVVGVYEDRVDAERCATENGGGVMEVELDTLLDNNAARFYWPQEGSRVLPDKWPLEDS